MNTLQVMHSNPEDFLNYDLLTRHTGRAPVYARDDPHRTRTAQLASAVNSHLWDPLAAQHLQGTTTSGPICAFLTALRWMTMCA